MLTTTTANVAVIIALSMQAAATAGSPMARTMTPVNKFGMPNAEGGQPPKLLSAKILELRTATKALSANVDSAISSWRAEMFADAPATGYQFSRAFRDAADSAQPRPDKVDDLLERLLDSTVAVESSSGKLLRSAQTVRSIAQMQALGDGGPADSPFDAELSPARQASGGSASSSGTAVSASELIPQLRRPDRQLFQQEVEGAKAASGNAADSLASASQHLTVLDKHAAERVVCFQAQASLDMSIAEDKLATAESLLVDSQPPVNGRRPLLKGMQKKSRPKA